MMDVKKNIAEFAVLRCIMLLMILLRGIYVQAACTFPSHIQETWVRGRDTRSLTFTASDITGLDIKYNSQNLGTFSCRMSSGDIYVIASNSYSTTIEDKKYYMCWKLQEVTNLAYLLYELTDAVTDSSYQGEPGIIESETDDSSITLSQVCTRSPNTQPFTTLIKKGATNSNIAAPCPPQITAKHSYALCPNTELDFCSNPGTVTANYSKCPTTIFNSATGVLSCLGYVARGVDIYLNLIRHDDGSAVTCFRFHVVNSGTISGQYYSGDCTTAAAVTSLTLTKTQDCTPATSSSNSEVGLTAGIIAGVLLGAALFVILVVVKKKLSSMMSVSQSNNTTKLKEYEADVINETPGQLDKTQITDSANVGVHESTNGEIVELGMLQNQA